MMRKILSLAPAFFLFLSLPEHCQADDRDAAMAVIDQAIQAHGGEQRLAKSHLRTRTARGVLSLQARDVAFTTDLTMDLPERFHDVIEVSAEGEKNRLTQAINGAKGWRATGGVATDLENGDLEDLREEAHALWLTTLVPLKEKSFELSVLPDSKVDGQPVARINVTSKGHADCKLFFDRKTGLLIKEERQARLAGLQVKRADVFADFKEFDGLKLPTKVTELINGNKTTELTIGSYKFPTRVDDRLFAKP